MKTISITLLGLLLCAPVCAEINTEKIHGLHEGCELRPKSTGGSNEHLSAGDWFYIGSAEGYITGYTEATSGLHGKPDTVGELHDAVCKYIDLHPEIWNLSSREGLDLVLHKLYGETR